MVTKKQLKAQVIDMTNLLKEAQNCMQKQRATIDAQKKTIETMQHFAGLCAVNILVREVNEGHIKL